jgi:uncharacterized protein (TIGR00162 family)
METKIKVLKEVKLNRATMFTGLPGIGLVGKIVVDYLLKEFNAIKIAEIYSDSFPPSVHTRNGVVDLIKDDIYFYSHEDNDYVFLCGPVQPALDLRAGTSQEHYEFARKIVDFSKKIGVGQIYTLAGINVGEGRLGKKPRIICAGTNKQLIDELKADGAVSDQPEGLISGAAGLILGVAKEEGIPGACLMGETTAKLVYGDHGAAKSMLELLTKKFGFQVDMKKIEKESKEIEKAFKQLSKQIEAETKSEGEESDESLTYIR